VFSLGGRPDVALDVEFLSTNGNQCGNTGTYTVTSNTTASFLIDTDDNAGGCTERFRLKRRPVCTPRTSCNAGECGNVPTGVGARSIAVFAVAVVAVVAAACSSARP
jgi:hypothetical protein